MIPRHISPHVLKLSKKYPIITITGPRQSGKTTLCKALFPKKAYVSLEDLDVRDRAQKDPRGFLNRFSNGAIIDEIQRVPDLFSYLQTHVDAKDKPGQFILTGSAQFELLSNISQSLAGRTALITLLPFSLEEAYSNVQNVSIDSLLYHGFYPRIFDKKLNPTEAMASYNTTYVERDARNLIHVQNLSKFQLFLKLCANRTGQILNFSSIAAEAGINHLTASQWASVLKTSYIVFLLQPHFKNFNKRLIKAPKLYFLDTALACYLMNIDNVRFLAQHPARGALFETFVISELLKQRTNNLKQPNLFYWRDNTGHELDVIMDFGTVLLPIEIKSGETIASDFFNNLNFYRKINPACKKAAIIYGGNESFEENENWILSYKHIGLLATLDDRLKIKLPKS